MRHQKLLELEHHIKTMFDEIDDWLEDRYGEKYQLHPNRPKRGTTSNKEMDGLFNIGADFSGGYGSDLGRGYVVRIQMSTLDHIPESIRKSIRMDTENLVRMKLKETFQRQELRLEHDGAQLKIVGDFSLGPVSTE